MPYTPILARGAEAGPVDGTAQADFLAGNACLLHDLPFETRDHILVGPHLAAQTVIFAKMGVMGAIDAMDQQRLLLVRRHDKA